MSEIVCGRRHPVKPASFTLSDAALTPELRDALATGARHNFKLTEGRRTQTFSALVRRHKWMPNVVRLVYIKNLSR